MKIQTLYRKYSRLSVERKQQIRRRAEAAAILTVMLLFLLACLSGCKTKTVVVTEYRDRIQHDTTLLVDSIYKTHYLYIKGDTVFQKDTIYKYKFLDRIQEVVQRDSVPYEVEVIREVKKPLTAWQHFIQGSGYALWGMLIVGIVILIVFIILKLKK